MSMSVPLMTGCAPQTLTDRLSNLGDEGALASFDGANAWLNSPSLTPEELRGRVVLVDFWTYTCINWLRTLPYVRAWDRRYREAGLTVVGVHTPEFDFEHDLVNVTAQSSVLGVTWPVALDNDYAVWDAFNNNYWPAVYLADAKGRIRYRHFGEEAYAETERAIQSLLVETGTPEIEQSLASVEPVGLEIAADWSSVQSPETYTGYRQSSGFAQEPSSTFDEPAEYTVPDGLQGNTWGLSGTWTVTDRAAVANTPGARIAFQFHARDLNLVMTPGSTGTAIPFRVTLDGQPVSNANGSDVRPDGSGVLDEPRTYQLVRQSGPIGWRRFELELSEPGAAVYCFTFG
jgi:thiol-disulfide isomerase/thioredoxin